MSPLRREGKREAGGGQGTSVVEVADEHGLPAFLLEALVAVRAERVLLC